MFFDGRKDEFAKRLLTAEIVNDYLKSLNNLMSSVQPARPSMHDIVKVRVTHNCFRCGVYSLVRCYWPTWPRGLPTARISWTSSTAWRGIDEGPVSVFGRNSRTARLGSDDPPDQQSLFSAVPLWRASGWGRVPPAWDSARTHSRRWFYHFSSVKFSLFSELAATLHSFSLKKTTRECKTFHKTHSMMNHPILSPKLSVSRSECFFVFF